MIKNIDKYSNFSFSQSGEDRIISFIFQWVGIKNPTYLDIGAHHYAHFSNTYSFYLNGSSGVCVEPDPILFQEISKKRKRDICLNVGVSAFNSLEADFYIMSTRSLNTFSKEDAYRCQNSNNFGIQKIEKIISIPLLNVNDLMQHHLSNGVNLISIDVEGLDDQILYSYDFEKYSADVICVETLRYDDFGVLIKKDELIEYMRSKGYFIYGDTYLNTIFVSSEIKNRLK